MICAFHRADTAVTCDGNHIDSMRDGFYFLYRWQSIAIYSKAIYLAVCCNHSLGSRVVSEDLFYGHPLAGHCQHHLCTTRHGPS